MHHFNTMPSNIPYVLNMILVVNADTDSQQSMNVCGAKNKGLLFFMGFLIFGKVIKMFIIA